MNPSLNPFPRARFSPVVIFIRAHLFARLCVFVYFPSFTCPPYLTYFGMSPTYLLFTRSLCLRFIVHLLLHSRSFRHVTRIVPFITFLCFCFHCQCHTRQHSLTSTPNIYWPIIIFQNFYFKSSWSKYEFSSFIAPLQSIFGAN